MRYFKIKDNPKDTGLDCIIAVFNDSNNLVYWIRDYHGKRLKIPMKVERVSIDEFVKFNFGGEENYEEITEQEAFIEML